MNLHRYARVSLIVAFVVIVLKIAAYWLTNSQSLLSDALESVVNILGASATMWALAVSEMPPDDEHAHGHDKAEYFSSGFEGALVLVAAVVIIATAGYRIVFPEAVTFNGIAIGLAIGTSVINYGAARWLMRAAKQHDSIALEADSHHLMSDVITSIGVTIGVIITVFSGWWWIDPLVAILVGANILRTGWDLVRRSVDGLLDASLLPVDHQRVHDVIARFRTHAVDFHAIRTRRSGTRKFLTFHVLVPGEWSVQRGHDLLEAIEIELHQAIPQLHVTTHLEPSDDPSSFHDIELHRPITQPHRIPADS
jgi:cation diffusion facilitator family transporter